MLNKNLSSRALAPRFLSGPGRRLRPEWVLACASLATVPLALVAAEGVLRLTSPTYLEQRPTLSLDNLHRYSEVYGWELRPGARQVQDDHWTTINAHGYRGRDVAARPELGRTRVVMLGDSITFGTYVGDGEVFSDRLAESGSLEIVNLAVQGYGLGQSLLKLEHEGLAYAPHVVVLNVCLANDFADTMLASFLYDARHPKPFFRLEGERLVLHDKHVRLSPLARLGRRLHERSHLYNRVLDWTAPAPAAPDDQAEGAWVARRNAALRDARAARDLSLRIVARMRALAESHGAAFVVVLHPDKDTFKHGSEWSDAFYAAPALSGVTIVNLAREYRRAGLRGSELMLDGIGHLSPDGHRHVAALLRAPLQRAAGQAVARALASDPPRS